LGFTPFYPTYGGIKKPALWFYRAGF